MRELLAFGRQVIFRPNVFSYVFISRPPPPRIYFALVFCTVAVLLDFIAIWGMPCFNRFRIPSSGKQSMVYDAL